MNTSVPLTPPRLELRGITKIYPSVIANENVDLVVRPGEIHAVLGENGAGKSTLMKIIYGVTKPDAGEMLWENREVHIASPAEARRMGIGMVFQHFSLFETLTVAENISLALDITIPPAELAERISAVSIEYGLPVDPHRLIHSMSVGERQRVEIVRCLLNNPKLLIMDEPTSVLTPQAVLKLFETLRRLAAEGCSILYISHKLDEIQALCDSATILRSGRVTGTASPKEETRVTLAQMMIGRELPECQMEARTPGETRLQVSNLSLSTIDPFGTTLKNINLEVRSGEIIGIAGISGNGQKELMAALSGEQTVAMGDVTKICGTSAGKLNPAQRRQLGLRFVPEERLGRGAVPTLSLALNALLTNSDDRMVKHGLIAYSRVRDFARNVITQFNVKCGGDQSLAGSLSGGNLQKFIVGREIMLAPKVMIVAQPTWGVDVGAAQLIRQAIIELRNQGVAVLVVSEELEELFMICDRIAVIADGQLSPIVATKDTTVEQIGLWMSGEFTKEKSEVAHA
jgi:simple sugar transport system ATP-binding protein